jgi:hypothetical protein
MDVIGHDQITTNEPRIGFFPRRNKRVMNIRVRETLPPISGTNGEEDNRGLATKDENAFRRIPASNVIAHIRLDGVSPYQNSAAWDRITSQNAIPRPTNVNGGFGRATLRGAGSTESRPTTGSLCSSDLSAPREDLRFCPRCFGFLNVAVPIIKKRQTGPADLIVGAQRGRAFTRFDCIRKSSQFHQRHAERVPAIEKLRIHFDAAAVFFHCALQLANGEITVRVVESFVARFHETGALARYGAFRAGQAAALAQPFVENHRAFSPQQPFFE